MLSPFHALKAWKAGVRSKQVPTFSISLLKSVNFVWFTSADDFQPRFKWNLHCFQTQFSVWIETMDKLNAEFSQSVSTEANPVTNLELWPHLRFLILHDLGEDQTWQSFIFARPEDLQCQLLKFLSQQLIQQCKQLTKMMLMVFKCAFLKAKTKPKGMNNSHMLATDKKINFDSIDEFTHIHWNTIWVLTMEQFQNLKIFLTGCCTPKNLWFFQTCSKHSEVWQMDNDITAFFAEHNKNFTGACFQCFSCLCFFSMGSDGCFNMMRDYMCCCLSAKCDR